MVSNTWRDAAFAKTLDKYEDLRFPATAINPPGAASDPDIDATYGWLLFDGAGATELVFLLAQMPHLWLAGTPIIPHVHWCKTTSASGNVFWRLDYRWLPIGETMADDWTTLTVSTPTVDDTDTAYHHALSSFGAIENTQEWSDMLVMKLSRVSGNAADTYTADCALFEFDIHYEPLDAKR